MEPVDQTKHDRRIRQGLAFSGFSIYLKQKPRGAVCISASCILRSLEVFPDQLTAESRRSEVNEVLTCHIPFEMHIPNSPGVREEKFAVLYEVFDLGYSPRRMISWVIFPLLEDLKEQYRLPMNSVARHCDTGILDQLRNTRFAAIKSGIFIQFRVTACLESYAISESSGLSADITSENNRIHTRSYSSSPMQLPTSVLRRIEISGSEPINLMRWSSDYQLIALATPTGIVIYSVPEAELSARLDFGNLSSSLEWSGGYLLIAYGKPEITIWNILTGEIRQLSLPHQVGHLLSAQGSPGFIMALGGDLLTRFTTEEAVAQFPILLPDKLLAVYLARKDLLVFFSAVNGIFTASHSGESWGCSKCSNWSGEIEFAHKSCFADNHGAVYTLDSNPWKYAQVLQSSIKLTALSMSDTSNWFAIATADGRIHIHETLNGNLLFTSSVFFPSAVRLVEWSVGDRMLSIYASPEGGYTLPVIILSSPDMLPRMSESLSNWASNWSSRVSPGMNVIDGVADLKRKIIRLILDRPHS